MKHQVQQPLRAWTCPTRATTVNIDEAELPRSVVVSCPPKLAPMAHMYKTFPTAILPTRSTTAMRTSPTEIWTQASSMCGPCRTKISRRSRTAWPRCARRWQSLYAAGRLCLRTPRMRAILGIISDLASPCPTIHALSRDAPGMATRSRAARALAH